MFAPPADSDQLKAGFKETPVPPPSPPGPSTLVASPRDSPKPEKTPVTFPSPVSSPPPDLNGNQATVTSMGSQQPRSTVQVLPEESNLPMGPVQTPSPVDSLPLELPEKAVQTPPPDDPLPPELPEKVVAPESPANHPEVVGTPQLNDQGQFSNWSIGLYDCRSDMDTCCLVFWCPCIAFGRMAEILDEGKSSCCCQGTVYSIVHVFSLAAVIIGAPVTFHFLLSYKYRGKLKRLLNLPPSRRDDCLTHLCCEPCALCQEYRELQTHGYDLPRGWHGNMDKSARQAMPTMVEPPLSPTMKR